MPCAPSIETTLTGSIVDVEPVVRQALSNEGFGVLTEIDVAATLQAKLGVRRAALKILGACNPSFAHRALEAEPAISLVLPCNVVLEDVGDGRTRVAVADPRWLLGMFPGSQRHLEAFGEEAGEALDKVVAALGGLRSEGGG